MSSVSLLILSIPTFVSSVLAITCQSMVVMVALQSLSDGPSIHIRFVLVSFACLFPLKLRFSAFLLWGAVFSCVLDILCYKTLVLILIFCFSGPPLRLLLCAVDWGESSVFSLGLHQHLGLGRADLMSQDGAGSSGSPKASADTTPSGGWGTSFLQVGGMVQSPRLASAGAWLEEAVVL